jgi:acyl carrier protein
MPTFRPQVLTDRGWHARELQRNCQQSHTQRAVNATPPIFFDSIKLSRRLLDWMPKCSTTNQEIAMTLTSLSATQPGLKHESKDADKIRTLIGEYLGIDAKRVMGEAHFHDDLGIDWLGHLELMILVEDKFPGVQITNKDADQIEVVGDLIRHIGNNESLAKGKNFVPISSISTCFVLTR